jgi:hypothetical protein
MPSVSPEEKEYIENNLEYGGVLAPKELVEERLSICATCPSRVRTLGVDRCGECGCLLRLKTRLLQHIDFLHMKKVTTACPLKKW